MSVDRKPGPSLRIALALLVIGVMVAVPAAVTVALRAVRTLSTSSISTPGALRRHLAPGTWFVFQRTGTTSGGGGFTVTRNDAPTLTPSEVTVTAPDGSELEVRFVTVNETITKGSRIYTAVVQFKAASSGSYTVRVQTPGSEVIIARSLGETFRGILGLVAVGSVGGVLIAAGVILLIVGYVRRNRADHLRLSHRSASPTPAGWYLDPSQSGRLRWWEGTRWTDHYA
jgi:hypothetical protein